MQPFHDVVLEDLYPSRSEDNAGILPRLDPVVFQEPKDYGRGPLSHDLVSGYADNGFLFLEGVFSKGEVEDLRKCVEELLKSEGIRGRPTTITEESSDEIRSLFSIHALGGLLQSVSFDSRLVDIARFLLGDEVYIHQSRLNVKPAFHGKEFHLHSDFETWHIEDGMPTMRAVTCSLNLTDNTVFNGPLMLIPGSHRHFVSCLGQTPPDHYKTSLKRQEYGVPSDATLSRLISSGGIVEEEGSAGSVLFFDCNALHASNCNLSPWPRINLFVVYNSVSNSLGDPFSGMPPRPEFIGSRNFDRVVPLRR